MVLAPNNSALPLNRYIRKRYRNTGSNNNQSRQASHLVKHTDIVPSLSTSVRMVVMVMELWTTHPAQARFAHASRSAGAHASRWWQPCWTAGTSHVRGLRLLILAIRRTRLLRNLGSWLLLRQLSTAL